MQKLKTDEDIAVYLRNITLALSKLAQSKGITIDLRACPDGYAKASFGDYTFTRYTSERERYRYEPLGKYVPQWGMAVKPNQIQIGRKPLPVQKNGEDKPC